MRVYHYGLFLLSVLACAGLAGQAVAEEKSIFSPIIHVDKEKGFIVVSADAKVFPVEVGEAAKPHLDKLPVSGMIDMVVELRPGANPLLKKWKLAGGESSCKEFDGKTCK